MEMYDAKWLAQNIKYKINFFRYMENADINTYNQTELNVYEYLGYNVRGFKKIDLMSEVYNLIGTDIEIPIFTIVDISDNPSPYIFVINNDAGELYYLFKNKTTLDKCVENNNNIISFGIKTGESLYFIKHYINDEYMFHEEYRPGKTVITNVSKKNTTVPNNELPLNTSPFLRGGFCPETEVAKICVKQIGDNEYEVCFLDLIGKKKKTDIYEGQSLYSAYYQYMIDNGYFNEDELEFVTTARKI